MKTQVLAFFIHLPKSKSDQFNKAFQLYRKCPGKSLAQEGFYNRAGFSPNNLETILYDLKKMAGVSDSEIRNAKAKGIKIDKPITESQKESIEASKKAILKEFGATNKEEVFTKAPDFVKEEFKLKDEFPFLKEEDCPDEFYILVGKKFNHYDAYVAAHKDLLVTIPDTEEDAAPIPLTQEEINTLAKKAVENFVVNQQIWDELNHYKETGKVLGKHPVFVEYKLKEKVGNLTVEDVTKRVSLLDGYIRRDTKKLEKAQKSKNKADIEKFEAKVLEWQTELKMIKKKFNFKDE
tara:strand:- start:5412 stop:6290 length:879 start_codon:yes stop_codon:yes gene_type:complete